MTMHDPSHPGDILKEDVLAPLGLSDARAAELLGVTRPALAALLDGQAALSVEMALRIEKAFGVSMDTLLRMQTSYEIAEARRKASRIRVKPFSPKSLAA